MALWGRFMDLLEQLRVTERDPTEAQLLRVREWLIVIGAWGVEYLEAPDERECRENAEREARGLMLSLVRKLGPLAPGWLVAVTQEDDQLDLACMRAFEIPRDADAAVDLACRRSLVEFNVKGDRSSRIPFYEVHPCPHCGIALLIVFGTGEPHDSNSLSAVHHTGPNRRPRRYTFLIELSMSFVVKTNRDRARLRSTQANAAAERPAIGVGGGSAGARCRGARIQYEDRRDEAVIFLAEWRERPAVERSAEAATSASLGRIVNFFDLCVVLQAMRTLLLVCVLFAGIPRRCSSSSMLRATPRGRDSTRCCSASPSSSPSCAKKKPRANTSNS
jgi:hypothetical protein